VWIETNDAASVTASILAGVDTTELRGLTVSQPSLEAAFLQLTGSTREEPDTELPHVA
jgi:hypothetical protein